MATMNMISSREFNQDVSRVKKAAEQGPVFITDRGRPAHVLLSIDEYRKLTEKPFLSLADAFSAPDGEPYIEFEPAVDRRAQVHQPFDFA